MEIGPDTDVPTLLEARPELVRVLVRLGLPCYVCGEPVWGTLRELCERHGKDLDTVLAELRRSGS